MIFKSFKPDDGPKSGEYEVYLAKAGTKETRGGDEIIEFDFVVRSDVEQSYQNKHIFKSFWRDDDGNWPVEKIGRYAHAMGIEDGEEFDLGDLIGLGCVLVMGEYKGKTCIRFPKPSEHGEYLSELPKSDTMAELEDDDGELPF